MRSTARAVRQGKRKSRKGSIPAAAPASEPTNPDSFSSGVVDNPKSDLPQAIPILIVDDHPLFRHGLAQLINSDDGYSICGEASSAPEAIALVRKLRPKLAIVDLGLKGPSGIELSVIDDGVGISANSHLGAGMGFHIMQYRARSIGARLEVKPIKPHGTRVTCYVQK